MEDKEKKELGSELENSQPNTVSEDMTAQSLNEKQTTSDYEDNDMTASERNQDDSQIELVDSETEEEPAKENNVVSEAQFDSRVNQFNPYFDPRNGYSNMYGNQMNREQPPYFYGYYGNGYYPPYPVNREPEQTREAKPKRSNMLVSIVAALLAVCLIFGSVTFGVVFSDLLISVFDNTFGDGLSDTPKLPGSGNQPNGGILPSNSSMIDPDFDLTQPVTPGNKHTSLSDAYYATKNTVVSINVVMSDGRPSAGSGVIISRMKDNVGYYIVTNNHVVEDVQSITVKLNDDVGTVYKAHKTYFVDPLTDLAVIAIETTDTLSVAKIGSSASLKVGEDIFIIGNPLGTLGGTLTNGIISAQAVNIFVADHFMKLLQTNAAINPGNSGGAMFNMAGELVGIVNSKYSDVDVEGIGFAIPIDTAVPIIEQMITQGYVTGRYDHGITAEFGYLYDTQGVWIDEVTDDSPLAKAGFVNLPNRYYKLNSINGTTFKSLKALIAYLDSLKAGDIAKFEISEIALTSTGIFGNANVTVVKTVTYDVELIQESAIVNIP